MRKTKAKDPEIVEMNERRAGWAMVAVEAFMAETMPGADEDVETGFYDLLVDMIHLCDVEGWNFLAILARARLCYEEEQEEL
jgi:hypothetical protein